MEYKKISASILDYILHEDLLYYSFGLQIIEDELNISDFGQKNKILEEILVDLLQKQQIIIGTYKGPNEVEPWSGDVEEVKSRLKNEIEKSIRHGDKPDFFWIGFPQHRFKGH